MKNKQPVKQINLFSTQTVIGNSHLQNKQQKIIDQLAVILLNYFVANQTSNFNKSGDQSCQVK